MNCIKPPIGYFDKFDRLVDDVAVVSGLHALAKLVNGAWRTHADALIAFPRIALMVLLEIKVCSEPSAHDLSTLGVAALRLLAAMDGNAAHNVNSQVQDWQHNDVVDWSVKLVEVADRRLDAVHEVLRVFFWLPAATHAW